MGVIEPSNRTSHQSLGFGQLTDATACATTPAELVVFGGAANGINRDALADAAAAAASIGPDPGPQYIRPELISGGNAPKSIPNPFSGCGVANDI